TIFKKKIDTIIELGQFKGKNNQILSLFTDGVISSPRLFLIGLGEEKKLTLEQYRRAAASAAKQATSAHAHTLALVIPPINSAQPITEPDIAYAFAEGTYLSEYKFDKYFTEKKNHTEKLKEALIIFSTAVMEKPVKKSLQDARIVCEAVKLARDLANAPGNEIYPETLADAARSSGQTHGYRVTVWDKQRIEQAKFGGLLGVSAGSTRHPRFIILEHNGGQKNLDTIVLVGKGVTFDAGGISIKPANGMSEMKMDMSGAAAVIGTMEAASRLKLPVHLVGLVPATENLLGGSAMKPGDIITHYGGKTSEVDNTDAEGRLILADALAYASTYKPKAVIDL
ncbi:MAG TPA: M17 family peptidase N-terminal domain-containing protein, partial [Bacteroidota bacterium]|nr:M17 family peptidase N-terminal domain-containing protein [Bacteroidota bacterium]